MSSGLLARELLPFASVQNLWAFPGTACALRNGIVAISSLIRPMEWSLEGVVCTAIAKRFYNWRVV